MHIIRILVQAFVGAAAWWCKIDEFLWLPTTMLFTFPILLVALTMFR
jgi:hypothetical protein